MISGPIGPWIPEKGKHLVYATELETRDEDGELVCENQFVTFVRNQGGYGGTNEVSSVFPLADKNKGSILKNSIKPKTIVQPIEAPDRAPDFETEELVPEGQAALYRSGVL